MEYITENELIEGKKKVAENVRNRGIYPKESIWETFATVGFCIVFGIFLYFVIGWVSAIYYRSVIRKILLFILSWIVLIPLAGIPMAVTQFFDRVYGNIFINTFEKKADNDEVILNRIKLQEKLYDQVYDLVNQDSYTGDRKIGDLIKAGQILKPGIVFEMYKNIKPEFRIGD